MRYELFGVKDNGEEVSFGKFWDETFAWEALSENSENPNYKYFYIDEPPIWAMALYDFFKFLTGFLIKLVSRILPN